MIRVVDASVVLSWLLHDPPPAQALQMLEEHITEEITAVGPELLQYEVANVLVCGAGLPAAGARSGHERFRALEVDTFALGTGEYELALSLAREFRITVYDASYLALARSLGVRVATADRKLARRVARLDLVDVV